MARVRTHSEILALDHEGAIGEYLSTNIAYVDSIGLIAPSCCLILGHGCLGFRLWASSPESDESLLKEESHLLNPNSTGITR